MKYVLNTIERGIDALVSSIRRLLGLKRPQVVLPYLSYGRADDGQIRVRVIGRVVEETTRYEFNHTTKRSNHLFQVIRLFLTRKVPKAKAHVELEGQNFDLICNEEGFFAKTIEAKCQPMNGTLDQRLLKFSRRNNTNLGRFITPTPHTHCLIVSDIDDTVLKSHATSFWRLAYKTLFHPVHKRQAFEDAASVYRSMVKGKFGDSQNLIFYVSSSTWNIYPLLQGFLELNEFPTGPVILQDIATERKNNPDNSHGHKLDRISEIAEFYPEYPLVLIGDAGQHDPELYFEAAKKYENRVQIILIRQSWWHKAIHNNDRLMDEAKELGINLIYFEDLSELREELKEFVRFE